MEGILENILKLLFPEKCVGCKKVGSLLCELCLQKTKSAERETARHITAVFDYREPTIKRALWELKYSKKKNIGKIVGEYMYESKLEEIADIKIFSIGLPIIVTPVPLSKKRLKERGYNQAEIIAKSFIKNAPEKLFVLRTDLIIKKKDTLAQARIKNRKERLANISGAFTLVKEDEVKGRTIIVIDDITTTGGTITEIIKLLKDAGAKKVVGFAVAH